MLAFASLCLPPNHHQLEHDMTSFIALSLIIYGFARAGVGVSQASTPVIVHGALFIAFGLALARMP